MSTFITLLQLRLRVFIGGEALHLIVFNLHQPSIESVQYWLQAVRHRAADRAPYIILVGTHADKFASEAEVRTGHRFRTVYSDFLVSRYFQR